jgi:hypothetical protein
MKSVNQNKKLALALLLFAAFVLTPAAMAATVSTDKGDYAPGETVYITGAGFEAGEPVDLSISIVEDGEVIIPDVDWTIEFADDYGAFQTEYVVPERWLGKTLLLTAEGYASGLVATTTFTDAGNLQIIGTDATQHNSSGGAENLGSVTLGDDLVVTIELRVTGGGSPSPYPVNWSIGYVSAYGNGVTLDTITTFDPSLGSFSGAGSVDVDMTIDTDSLPSGTTYQGRLQATASTASTADYYFQFSVTAAGPTNATPVLTAPSDQEADEGSSTSFALGSFVDSDNGPWAVVVNWGDGTGNTEFTMASAGAITAQSHTYADGPDEYTVTVTVTDSLSAFDSATFTVTVNNVAPNIALTGDSSVNEGSLYSLGLGAVTDPGQDTVSDYSIDWGDGTTKEDFVGSPVGLTKTHTYADGPNGYTITVYLTDEDGTFEGGTLEVQVNNVAPVVGAITITPSAVVAVNTAVGASASFTDPGVLDTHSASWDWGDGTSSVGTVTQGAGSGTVSDNHTYSSAGIYTVTLTVTDNDGDSGTSTYEYVVVYDPSAGFVTGGGWIDSPTGADKRLGNEALTGKANFGFVAKYKKGANEPDGNTEFQFKAGNLNFHSTWYQWLVVAGTKATFKGEGTINGMGNYGFMLSAIDGTPDKFRIKIWDKDADDFVVYDNLVDGGGDDADPTTALGGGSIIVHTGKEK